MTSDLPDYLTDLEEILKLDLKTCDEQLLASLKSLWNNQSAAVGKRVDDKKSEILEADLYIADFEVKKGPFKFYCLLSWTGNIVRKKIAQNYGIPVEYIHLSTDSQLISDDSTLNAYGISKVNKELFVFVVNKNNIIQEKNTTEITEAKTQNKQETTLPENPEKKSLSLPSSNESKYSPVTVHHNNPGQPSTSSTWV